jgi:hypothetical protein
VFNSLSFFFTITTVLVGADAALPNLQDDFIGKQIKSIEKALIQATILLVISVVCGLGVFASVGFSALPPLLKYDTNMIVTILFRWNNLHAHSCKNHMETINPNLHAIPKGFNNNDSWWSCD